MAQRGRFGQADLEAWLHAYGNAWESRNAAVAAELFAPDALYYETPYSEPFRGRTGIHDYWARVTADQRDVDFEAKIVGVVGNTGVAEWSATFTSGAGDARVELNGVFLLEFDTDRRCTRLREWWHAR